MQKCTPKSLNFRSAFTEYLTVSSKAKTRKHIIKHVWGVQIDPKSNTNQCKIMIDKGMQKVWKNTLKWIPKWDCEFSVKRTINWYLKYYQGKNTNDLLMDDIKTFYN